MSNWNDTNGASKDVTNRYEKDGKTNESPDDLHDQQNYKITEAERSTHLDPFDGDDQLGATGVVFERVQVPLNHDFSRDVAVRPGKAMDVIVLLVLHVGAAAVFRSLAFHDDRCPRRGRRSGEGNVVQPGGEPRGELAQSEKGRSRRQFLQNDGQPESSASRVVVDLGADAPQRNGFQIDEI